MAASSINKIPRNEIIEWDVLNWSGLINYWQPIIEKFPRDAKVLAIGERRGGISLWLSSLGFNVECTDIVDYTAEAKELHKKYGVENKISYRFLDIVNECPGIGEYDIIISKSVIGGLKMKRSKSSSRSKDAQINAIDNIHKALKPGGYFFCAENMRGGALVRWMRRRKGKKKGWEHLDYVELPSMFSNFSIAEIKTFGIFPTLFTREWLNSIMYFLNRYVLFFSSSRSRYIAFIAARK